MITINLVWDANALAAPQSFRTAVQAAASILDAAIYDPITVNIGIGYGEYDNGSTRLNQGYSLGGVTSVIGVSYSALKAALTGNASSTTDSAALAALPSTSALNGQTQFEVGRAQAKALGALSATDTGIDGYAGFPTSFTGTTLTGGAIVEILHAMGLINGELPLTLFEYTSPGVHLLTDGSAATPAYFSLDGGNTSLGSYDVGYDSTLFSNPTNDPLSVPISGNLTLTTLDLEEIAAIGFNVTSTRAPPTPTITPTTTAAGTKPTVTVQNGTITANTATPISSFIKSVSVAAGDSLASYDVYDTGTDGGHLVINGIVEPTGQYIDVLSTQLNVLDYLAGSTPGTDTIYIAAIDADSTGSTPVATITITTTAGTSSGGTSSGTTTPISTAPGSVTTNTNANGSVTITTTIGTNTVQLGAAQTTVTSNGTDTITASTGAATITTYGNARIIGGAGALTVQGGPGNDVVLAGTGGLTFTGGGGFDTIVGGGYTDNITAGTGGGLFQGGGNATIIAGAGGTQNVEFGSNGDQMYGVGPSGVLFGDNGGNSAKPTLMSSAGDTGNSVFFGASGTGQMTFITGAGNDLLAVGQGTNTVRLGAGTDVVFANGPAAGSTTITAGTGNASIVMGGALTDLIIATGTARSFSIYNDASSTDKITLTGYASTQIASALANQVSAGGGSILTLADGTTLALVGVQHATASLFG